MKKYMVCNFVLEQESNIVANDPQEAKEKVCKLKGWDYEQCIALCLNSTKLNV